ncbi:MAG: cyclic nucleotide-binding domain-containing protein [Candidatus Poribacteria bacterium]|nr:cyclic nucleotide-binding domain-containing protein [Candidatus Poribacteria bacterium]
MDGVSTEELKKFSIFSGLPREKLNQIADLIRIESVDQGSLIIEDGTTGSTMYLLLEGEVEISKNLVLKISKLQVDQKTKMLNRYSAKLRLVFGEIALLDAQSKRSATVIAVTPCTLGVISIKEFLKQTEADMEIGYHVFKNMAAQLSEQLKKANEDTLNLTTALSFALQR